MRQQVSQVVGFFARLLSFRYSFWVILTLLLLPLLILARVSATDNLTIFLQLVILYAIDSALYFLTERVLAKIGLLTLIFLFSMEVMVAIFYFLSIYAGGQL